MNKLNTAEKVGTGVAAAGVGFDVLGVLRAGGELLKAGVGLFAVGALFNFLKSDNAKKEKKA